MAPKFIWIHNYMESAELAIKLEKAPNVFKNTFFWIHDQIRSADLKLKLKMVPNFTWILVYIKLTNLTVKLKNISFGILVYIKLTNETIKLKNISFWIQNKIQYNHVKIGSSYKKHYTHKIMSKTITINPNATSTTPTSTPTYSQIQFSTFLMVNFSTTIGGQSNGGSTECENNTPSVQPQHNDL